MARFFALILAALAMATTSALAPLAPRQVTKQTESRADFLKSAAAAAAGFVAVAPANAVNPMTGQMLGKSKGKNGQIKTGNAGSILKK